jgi:hypothetical protein
VAETHVSNAKYPGLYVSEKSCKPLAHAHAFVTYGPAGILKYWQHLGFETFSHRINESYDNELNPDKKLQMIMAVLEDLYSECTSTGQVFQDAKTQAILSHSQNLFFNRERIEKLFEQQIVDPIMEFLEST